LLRKFKIFRGPSAWFEKALRREAFHSALFLSQKKDARLDTLRRRW